MEQKTIRRLLFVPFLAVVLLASGAASAERPDDILIIVNAQVKGEDVSQDELKAIFLKNRTHWSSGARAIPVFAKDAALHGDFRERFLKMRESEEAQYWQRMNIQRGTEKPVSFANTVKAVYQLKGSVSYIYRSQYVAGVTNVVLVLPATG